MVKNKQPIIVIDSGIGGLKFAKNLYQLIRNEQIIYFADDLYMPYGNKPKEFLKDRLEIVLNFFIEHYQPKLIIFACNTAGAVYSKFLKNKFKTPIFCVSPLHDYTTNSLIISTKLTQKLIRENCTNCQNYTFKSCPRLATNIEEHFFNKARLAKIVSKIGITEKDKNIVLGCTHYELIESEFKSLFPNSNIICPSKYCLDDVVGFLNTFYQTDITTKGKNSGIKTRVKLAIGNKFKDDLNQISFLCSTGSKSYTDKLKTIFVNYL